MKHLLPLLVALVAGCASPTIPTSHGEQSPDQIKAMTADKNVTITCAMATNLLNKLIVVTVMFDKSAIVSGSVSVSGEDCTAKIVAAPKGE